MTLPLIVQTGRWEPGKRRMLPAHRNAGLEIVYVSGGQSLWQIEGVTHRVWPGSMFYTLPWQKHGGVEALQPGLTLWFVVIGLDRHYTKPARRIGLHPDLPVKDAFRRRLSSRLVTSDRHALPATPAMRWLLPQLVKERSGSRPDANIHLPLVQLILTELLRCMEQPSEENPTLLPAHQRVHWFLTHLARTCERPWSLAGMAQACGLSRTRTGDLIRQITGDTPVMALNRLRIDRAQRLLRETDRSITDIALDCGFQSSQYFARTFKAYVGSRPRDARPVGRTPARKH